MTQPISSYFARVLSSKSLLATIAFVALLITSTLSAENKTDIILINGMPALAEVTTKGALVKKIIDVPDYFRSSRSHASLLKRSLNKARGLSAVNTKKTRSIGSIPQFLKQDQSCDSLCSEVANSAPSFDWSDISDFAGSGSMMGSTSFSTAGAIPDILAMRQRLV